MKENCLRCGIGWERRPEQPRRACTGCGTADWDVEVDLAAHIGARMEYRIVEERQQGPGYVMSLDLQGIRTTGDLPTVELNHRLLVDYRKVKGNLNLPDGRDGVISFDRAIAGEAKGKWVITNFRLRHPHEVRREITQACPRHKWAIKVVLESNDINALGDQLHCACPADPPCEVCTLGAQFSFDRRKYPSQTRHWSELNHAVRRDLGQMG